MSGQDGRRMAYNMDGPAKLRLHEFFETTIGSHLRRPEQRESFATYAIGILGDGARKSVEPIAARIFSDPVDVQRCHDRLLYFMRDSPWSDHDVRRAAAIYATKSMQAQDTLLAWIIDDTGFLKQGKNSVGVQRQYTGTAGKVTNCQIGVSLTVASRTEHVPIDFELYLPHSWLDDEKRRRQARIPAERVFKTKLELALDMIKSAKADGIPGDIVLADSAYGDSTTFRNSLRELGLDFAVGVKAPTLVWLLDQQENAERIVGVQELGIEIGTRGFRRFTWRTGTKKKLSSRFCFRRVKPAHGHAEPEDKEPLWLVMEWPDGEEKPTKFALTTLPRRMSKKQIIRILKERWRTEKAYEELKEELGLDHFEGRSFTGWHHHITVVLCCYAFIVSERMRHFSPSARGQARSDANDIAA
jgi:SRSO17 transposase